MFGLGKKETEAEKEQEKEDKALANKLAGETPSDEQVGLYAQTPQLNAFGEIPASSACAGSSFVDRKDKA
jgi:hypothetical protein